MPSYRTACRSFSVRLLSFLSTALFLASLSAAQKADVPPYKNTKLSFEERAADLASRLTLEEKISLLGHTSDAVTRLGIPEYNWWNEGLHGVARAGVATVFPQAIGLAATFNDSLLQDDAVAISTEFRAKFNSSRGKDGSSDWYKGLTVWSPNINIFRDPRWGRGQETYGEDPFLTSRMGVAFVTGLQGSDPRYLKTIATPKHFAVHSGPESTRHEVNVTVSRHDLLDTYLPAFRATLADARAGSVMCAYNSVNGQPACANDMLLSEFLRSDWHFQGYVVSDCGAIEDISVRHKFLPSMEQGVAAAFKAGTDLVCGSPAERVRLERTAALDAVHQGILSEAVVTQAVVRLLTARFRLGLFDPPSMVPWSKLSAAQNDTSANRALALRTARESIVLLKNSNDLLPLKKSYPTIAVIGPNADSLDALEGNYNGTPSAPVTILSGIRKRFASSKVLYEQGTGLVDTAVHPVPAANLYTSADKATRGLSAEYFNNKDLSGKPVFRRTDLRVNFLWAFNGVTPRLTKNYSVRWSGVLVPSESGDYLLGFTGQDGYRVWLDGKLLVEDWTNHRPATTSTAPVHLEKDHAYPIKIEYFQAIRSAEARLVWGLPGREEQRAVETAQKSDLVVMVLGLSARIEGEEMKVKAEGFAGGDRTSLDLPAIQQHLLESVVATGKPVVLVLANGSALSVNWADAHVPAILEAWYPGGEGGTAVASALAGDFSPAGRLPVTFYKSASQLPSFDDYSMSNRTYRYFSGEPLYPFGFGLGYSTFRYANPSATVSKSSSGEETAALSVEVTNTGSLDADEVVELYLTHDAVPGASLRELRGFRRIHLKRGESQTVRFALSPRDLSVVNSAGQRVLAPGTVRAWLGASQPISLPNLPQLPGASASFSLTASAPLPD